jgi:tetratricopeptide (TPR) repeat protein
VLETHRSLHQIVAGDRPAFSPESAVYWFYARGLTGRDDTLQVGLWRDWAKRYSIELREQLKNLAASISPVPVTYIVLWYKNDLIRHLQSTLETSLGAFGDALDVIIATDDPASLRAVTAEIGAALIDIPLHQLCSGLEIFLASPSDREEENADLPTISGAPVRLNVKDRLWLEEELEIVHRNVGLRAPDGQDIGRDFLRGAQISWFEIGLHFDVDRDKAERLEKIVRTQLNKKRTVRVNLYHAPGAGGTTVARRILWKFHNEFPAAILLRSNPSLTTERLYRLTSLTGMPVLLLIDSAQIADRQVDELFNHLRSRQVPVVLLQTLRRSKEQEEADLVRYLPAELSIGEARRFFEVFSRIEPSKSLELERLLTTSDPRARTAFYFGLETFGEDFLGLERYVGSKLANLNTLQKKIMGFLALAYHYAQRPLHAQAFADLLAIPNSRTVKLRNALPEEALSLLVESDSEEWRVAHELLAVEILRQLLTTPTIDPRLWRQGLSSWALDFIEFCRGNAVVLSEEMTEVARRAFIYRDNVDVLGTERAASGNFSHLIEDIPSREGRLEVLRFIVTLFPDEAHFWSHLGRYYSIEMRDYDEAFKCTERAILLQENDPVLHHMQGMVLRYQIKDLIGKQLNISEMVVLAKKASSAFGRARELNPDEEHAYISEVQLLIMLLNYAGRSHAGGVMGYLSLPSTDPYLREALERAEDLLEQVRRNREGEGPSSYEQDARGKLNALYGRYERALEIWDSLLSRPDLYRPPLRRQIAWTYLARHDRAWEKLAPREVERIVSLMEDNIQEDPANEKDLRLWVQAVRRSARPTTAESVIERLGYWRANSGALDSIYYLYVFNCLLAFQGSTLAREEALRYIDESKQLARLRRNRTKSFEWLGRRTGIARLVHQSELGEWDVRKDFWEHIEPLERVQGRISRIDSPQAGRIEVQGGLPAFFVPSRSGYTENRSENQLVMFYLGFSYDGLRAWEVTNA